MKSFDGFRLSYKKRFILGSILFFAFFGTVIFLLAKKTNAPPPLMSLAPPPLIRLSAKKFTVRTES